MRCPGLCIYHNSYLDSKVQGVACMKREILNWFWNLKRYSVWCDGIEVMVYLGLAVRRDATNANAPNCLKAAKAPFGTIIEASKQQNWIAVKRKHAIGMKSMNFNKTLPRIVERIENYPYWNRVTILPPLGFVLFQEIEMPKCPRFWQFVLLHSFVR